MKNFDCVVFFLLLFGADDDDAGTSDKQLSKDSQKWKKRKKRRSLHSLFPHAVTVLQNNNNTRNEGSNIHQTIVRGVQVR